MTDIAEERPKLVWRMGFMNAIYGFAYAVVLVTVPHLLAARGVAEPIIASLTALALVVSLAAFLFAPILDTLISRRAWSIALALAASAMTFLVLTLPPDSSLLAPVLALDALVASLFNAAIGGWLGSALPKGSDETIGTWFTIGNGAYAAPFIMMSQNRQQEIDRTSAENDHQVNLKAELEIELVHKKLNELREKEVMYLTKAVSDLTELLKAQIVQTFEYPNSPDSLPIGPLAPPPR